MTIAQGQLVDCMNLQGFSSSSQVQILVTVKEENCIWLVKIRYVMNSSLLSKKTFI